VTNAAESVQRQLRAGVRNRCGAGERILPAVAQGFFTDVQNDLDVRAPLVSDEGRTGRSGPANQLKRDFFEKLKTMWHSDRFPFGRYVTSIYGFIPT
jgi:hypothetical protein